MFESLQQVPIQFKEPCSPSIPLNPLDEAANRQSQGRRWSETAHRLQKCKMFGPVDTDTHTKSTDRENKRANNLTRVMSRA